MKRFWGRITAALVFFAALAPFSVHAQGEERLAVNRLTLEVVIQGSFGASEDGRAEVTLPDGSVITAEGELPEGVLLVVEPVEEDGKAPAWIRSLLEGKAANLRAHEIYFVDSEGERCETAETIRVTLPAAGYALPVVYFAAEETGAELLKSSAFGGQVSFAMTRSGIYVLGESLQDKSSTPSEEKPSDSFGGSKPTGSVKTGDETQTGAWLLLLAGAGTGIVALLRKKCRG